MKFTVSHARMPGDARKCAGICGNPADSRIPGAGPGRKRGHSLWGSNTRLRARDSRYLPGRHAYSGNIVRLSGDSGSSQSRSRVWWGLLMIAYTLSIHRYSFNTTLRTLSSLWFLLVSESDSVGLDSIKKKSDWVMGFLSSLCSGGSKSILGEKSLSYGVDDPCFRSSSGSPHFVDGCQCPKQQKKMFQEWTYAKYASSCSNNTFVMAWGAASKNVLAYCLPAFHLLLSRWTFVVHR